MPPAVAISSYEAVSPVRGGRLVNGLSFKEFTFDLTIVLSPSHMKSSRHCGSFRTHVGRPASNSGRLCTNPVVRHSVRRQVIDLSELIRRRPRLKGHSLAPP